MILLFLLPATASFSAAAGETEAVAAAIQNLRSADERVQLDAMQRLFDRGKESIPALIEEIRNDSKTSLLLKNPASSNIPRSRFEGQHLGVVAAYVIESILAREQFDYTNWIRPDAGGRSDASSKAPDYIYLDGTIYKKSGDEVTKADLGRLYKIYKKWWDKNRTKSLEELRGEWQQAGGPLLHSDYHWQ